MHYINGIYKYIAINTKTLENATQRNIDYIFNWFVKYNNDIIDESFESLEEKGMVKEFNSLEGLLLEVISIKEISEEEVIIELSKFRSGIGAIGMRYTLIQNDSTWEVKEKGMMWISLVKTVTSA